MPKSLPSGTLFTDTVVCPAPDSAARVYVIDDDSEVRRSLHFLLSTAGLVSWPFGSAEDFFDNLEALSPAPILLDIRMPEIDGIEAMTELRHRGVDWPVIIITAHGDIQVAVKAIKLGAIEFLEKPFEFEALDACLKSAFEKISNTKNAVYVRSAARARFDLLSPRETEVIDVLLQGIPNKTAAHLLSLSVRTIEMHRANALAKLQVKSIAEVVRLAGDADRASAADDTDTANAG